MRRSAAVADTPRMGTAGGSAHREHERRRERDAARRRSNLWQRLALTVATPLLAYAAVRIGLPWILDSLMASIAEAGEAEPPQPVDRRSFHLAALLIALGSTLTVVRELWGRRQSTEAWGKGARGEVETGRILEELPGGFVVKHDLRMPGSRANIDHLVIGPTGVFTIETKSFKDGVRIAGGRVTRGGRNANQIVDQGKRQADSIEERLGLEARPIVVVHGGVQLGWFSSPVVEGVRFCSPRRLIKVLQDGPDQMDASSVAAAVAVLDDAPAGPAPAHAQRSCGCGGTWVERTRRSDGAKFMGCSRFPACRATQSLLR